MTVGTWQRRKYKMFYHEGISFCWTPIFAASQQFFVGNAKGTRRQFPVHYIAASHVRSLKGLEIIRWNPDLISVNAEAQSHLDYLHSHADLLYTCV